MKVNFIKSKSKESKEKKKLNKDKLGMKADHIAVKRIYEYPVIKFDELKKVLDHFEDFHPYKIAFALLAIEGMRPIEVCNLTWDCFVFNDERTEIVKLRHLVYKARNSQTFTGTKAIYKEVEKPFFSKWLSDQIIGYSKRYPRYDHNKVFSFTKPDVLDKWLRKTRNKKLPGFEFLDNKNVYPLKGESRAIYRIHLYSLRRFSFTYHYYMSFKQDAVSLARCFGHSRIETTLNHYVFPPKAIGITDKDIKDKITIDKFIGLTPKKDQLLTKFIMNVDKEIKRMTVPGQRSLMDFCHC
jgi:integrase